MRFFRAASWVQAVLESTCYEAGSVNREEKKSGLTDVTPQNRGITPRNRHQARKGHGVSILEEFWAEDAKNAWAESQFASQFRAQIGMLLDLGCSCNETRHLDHD